MAADDPDKILYLNLIIHDVTEAVKARVSKKLERAVMIPNAVKAQAATRAGHMTSPKYVAQALAQSLCKKIPENMQKQGVTVELEEAFREHTFVVLQLKIKHVNPLTIMTSAWTEYGLSWILESIGPSNRRFVEDCYLPNMVTSLLAATVPKMLAEKMSDKKIDAETKVLRAAEQALYFYEKLNELRSSDHWDQRFTLNPIKTIYKRMSSSSTTCSITSGTAQPEEDESLAATSACSSSWSFPL
ncbi:hypothetical protein IV203_007122 [Nitzschia inconspicua]|uniref:Uncharacterized protein n=1 Tax=Nitzschia inconspicua TaxID=303405 RepID=A0A9K3KFA2_9STRA|nr:hypothetical protein IV203_007122 [Nitzschia inconspicua]